jgi:hypothetical protein
LKNIIVENINNKCGVNREALNLMELYNWFSMSSLAFSTWQRTTACSKSQSQIYSITSQIDSEDGDCVENRLVNSK